MRKNKDIRPRYEKKVREDSRKFERDLLTRIDGLQKVIAGLREHIAGFSAGGAEYPGRSGTKETPPNQFIRQLSDIEAENRRLSEQYVDIEQDNSNLANLYVTTARLQETLDRKQILSIVKEIIMNMVGTEEIGIFRMDAEKSVMTLESWVGIEPDRFRTVPLGKGIIGHVGRTGRIYINEPIAARNPTEPESDLTACIPLVIEGKVLGAIAIFRLLPQKSQFEPFDRELFDLLAKQAAMALYCAELHVRACAAPER